MKKKWIVGIGAAILVGICGCGNTIPTLTEEEENQIVNYAADIVLKYDSSYSNRLVELPAGDTKPSTPASKPTEEPSGKMDPVEDTPTVDKSEESDYSSIEEFYGLEGVTVTFKEVYFADSYSEQSENSYFALDAGEGKKLLVMLFEVSNSSKEATEVDFLKTNTSIAVSLNGEKKVNVLATMLPDDLSTYSEQMEAGESVELILLAKVEEKKADEVQSLSLTLKSESSVAKILLK